MTLKKYFLPLTSDDAYEIGQMLQYPYVGFNPVNPLSDAAARAAGIAYMDRFTPHGFNPASAHDQFVNVFDKPDTLAPPGEGAPTITGATGAGGAHADNSSTTDTVITIAVSLGSSGALAGDKLRLFDAGVQTGSDYTLLAGDIVAGTASVASAALAVSGTAHTLTTKFVRGAVLSAASNIWHITVTAAAGATWSPTFKGPRTTLSNGNQTAVSDNTGTNQAGRSETSISGTKKAYWEIHIDLVVTTSPQIGVGNASMSNADSQYLGIDTNSLGLGADGAVFFNNVSVATLAPFATGATIGIAVDFAAGKIWFTANGTTWNNAVIGVQNPVGAVGGITTPAGTLFPAYGLVWTAQPTINAGQSAFAYTPPTGFTAP